MRLIHTKTLELAEFFGNDIPEYAILSHTWGRDEVTLKDWKRLDAARGKAGFSKIEMACKQASEDGLEYLWADTACIDKRSSSELSEAINSMFGWYKNATVCYAYLADVDPLPTTTPQDSEESSKEHLKQFHQSRWFTRGWTLQELLAPRQMTFYAKDWSRLACRSELAEEISTATNIPKEYLLDEHKSLAQASIAQRMSWLSKRETTRVEDMAYCMLGIFDINMPLLYGEGSKAFTRLQEEIIRISADHTIFCWTWTKTVPGGWTSLLAPHPQAFEHSGGYVPAEPSFNKFNSSAFTMTNYGLSIDLPVIQAFAYQFAILNATDTDDWRVHGNLACVPIRKYGDAHRTGTRSIMRRVIFPPRPLLMQDSLILCQLPFYIHSHPAGHTLGSSYDYTKEAKHFGHAFLLLFNDTHSPRLRVDSRRGTPVFPPLNELSYMVRSLELIGLEVFPDEKFNKANGLVHLWDRSETDGVLIRLAGYRKSVVFFLGAEFVPSKRELRRFGGVIPQEWGQLTSEVLLEMSLGCMRARREGALVGWITDSSEGSISIASGIRLDFGDKIKYDEGYLFQVLINY